MDNPAVFGLPPEAIARLSSIHVELAAEAVDRSVGGGTDRAKIPAADFAGKDRSFPIVKPKDVADAAKSIGRAGDENYSAEQLRANITRIAKRKGAAFVARLPKAWQESLSHSEIDSALRDAIKAAHGARWAYLEAVYDDLVIYNVSIEQADGSTDTTQPGGDDYFCSEYTVDEESGEVALAAPFVVQRVVSYVRQKAAGEGESTEELGAGEAAGDACEFTGDVFEFSERAVADDGSFEMRIIKPGWGSSGYYSRDVLEKYVPKRFGPGTQMFWNHQTEAEERQRPEGDLHNLAAAIVTTPVFRENGTYGPGMYARAKAFSDYRGRIEEMAPHIGVSIRGRGHGVAGEAEGRKGRLFTDIVDDFRNSVDFVTKPGAGGQVVQMFESARGGAPQTPPEEEAHSMDELTEARTRISELETRNAELTETNTRITGENAQLREGELLRRARGIVETAVGAAKLPDVTKKRLIESLAANPPVVDDAIDEAAFAATISGAIDEAAAEVAAIAGGRVTGMGSGGGGEAAGQAQLREAMKRRFIDQGKSEEEADKLAALAVSGR